MDKTVEMKSGDSLRVKIEVHGKIQIVDVFVQGSVIMMQHEESQDSFIIRPSGNQFLKD